MKPFHLVSVVALLCSVGCAPLYTGSRDQAKKSCDNLASIPERVDCRKNYALSYDQYERQRQSLQNGESEKISPARENSSLCFKRTSTGQIQCPN